ncbi:DUF5777 family beta-barrel protein [Mangrovibacterium diazotrophicum]|uniref:DUF5777 domain-containing protein n=1 Tax=Mangrovibacterium diazotrophicum TaxID=1261403 RepID=A0A419VZ45_9BACT|nr:DUF5777 family beta-barrel protein [Mangrovibacterium diazotrophicum]RKD88434.1 hypothetical protein BC643_3583 [Mangrovibacterium diazotrophicum]
MKRILLIIISCLLVNVNLWAQDEVKEKDTPVGPAFDNGTLIDAQTSFIPDAKTLEFIIQHKFGAIEKESNKTPLSDMFGLYQSANVRLALNYVPIKSLQIGFGLTKQSPVNRMVSDFNAKWTILEQTENNTVPVFVTVFGNVGIDGSPKDDFGQLNNYENPTDTFTMGFGDRFSYFSQLIIGRKFSESISLQGGISFSHANYVKAWHDHDRIALHLSGRLKFSGQSSFIFNFDAPLKIDKISEQSSDWSDANPPHPDWAGPYNPKPSLKFGVEISTFTHAFQIYVGNAGAILPQMDVMNNMNKPFEGLAFGFTITRLWMY